LEAFNAPSEGQWDEYFVPIRWPIQPESVPESERAAVTAWIQHRLLGSLQIGNHQFRLGPDGVLQHHLTDRREQMIEIRSPAAVYRRLCDAFRELGLHPPESSSELTVQTMNTGEETNHSQGAMSLRTRFFQRLAQLLAPHHLQRTPSAATPKDWIDRGQWSPLFSRLSEWIDQEHQAGRFVPAVRKWFDQMERDHTPRSIDSLELPYQRSIKLLFDGRPIEVSAAWNGRLLTLTVMNAKSVGVPVPLLLSTEGQRLRVSLTPRAADQHQLAITPHEASLCDVTWTPSPPSK
jgi:hypothetical protein